VKGDVAHADQVKAIVDEAAAMFDGLDVLVNNAGGVLIASRWRTSIGRAFNRCCN